MLDDFGRLLLEGATLLRDLPRGHASTPSARARVAEWSERLPGLRAELLVHREPGSARADYDLLIEHPEGGTLAMTWQADDSVPWSVSHSEHWAANYVLTVDGESVTVQQALRMLRMSAQAHPDLVAELIEQKIILAALRQEQPPVADHELQDAADRFRRAKGLHGAADMLRWLRDTGLAMEQFEAILRTTVQLGKFKRSLSAGRIEPHFEAHHTLFDRVRIFEVGGLDETAAADLRARAWEIGLPAAAGFTPADNAPLPRLEGTLATRFAHQLPAHLRASRTGDVVGLSERDGSLSIAQVLGRQEAVLDDETRAAVQDAIFREWLARRREVAMVEWHWT